MYNPKLLQKLIQDLLKMPLHGHPSAHGKGQPQPPHKPGAPHMADPSEDPKEGLEVDPADLAAKKKPMSVELE